MSAIITLAILNILLYLQTPLFISSICGYGGGIINSFILNKKWTFGFEGKHEKSGNIFMSFILYNIVVMILFGYLNLGLFAVIGNKAASQILSICITTVLNYSVYKLLIFKKRPGAFNIK